MIPNGLLPPGTEWQIQGISATDQTFEVQIASVAEKGSCPKCSQLSSRVHSRKVRCFSDLPWAGKTVRMHLTLQRFFCDNEGCRGKTFAERFGTALLPYARRTGRLTVRLGRLGLRAGGEPGRRIAQDFGIITSADTILRITHSTVLPSQATPRVLGVDDWAIRKKLRYGTILVDLEKRRPIDLLEGREAKTLTPWLQSRPEIEIISRDRAQSYEEASSQGASQAEQVADRWHLIHNIREALHKELEKHRQAVNEAARKLMAPSAEACNGDPQIQNGHNRENVDKPTDQAVVQDGRQINYDTVKQLFGQGYKVAQIARKAGLSRTTVYNYLQSGQLPNRGHKMNLLLPFLPYVQQRLPEGLSKRTLWKEVCKLGYKAQYRAFCYSMLLHFPDQALQSKSGGICSFTNYSTVKLSYLLIQEPEKLSDDEREFCDLIRQSSQAVAAAAEWTRQFCKMLRRKKVEDFDSWLCQVEKCEIPSLASFAKGVRKDYASVKAAITSPWSNGQVEGQVNRLKMLKRQMFGRASFELLRKRFLWRDD